METSLIKAVKLTIQISKTFQTAMRHKNGVTHGAIQNILKINEPN